VHAAVGFRTSIYRAQDLIITTFSQANTNSRRTGIVSRATRIVFARRTVNHRHIGTLESTFIASIIGALIHIVTLRIQLAADYVSMHTAPIKVNTAYILAAAVCRAGIAVITKFIVQFEFAAVQFITSVNRAVDVIVTR